MADKGYLSNVRVRSAAGPTYVVNFIDPVRLQQDLAAEAEAGVPYFAEPNLVVLTEVTRDVIETAVNRLWDEGFFLSLKPDGAPELGACEAGRHA